MSTSPTTRCRCERPTTVVETIFEMSSTITNVSTKARVCSSALLSVSEIGHEKAQSVIDSITSSYAAEGQAGANPMLPQNQPQNFGAPPFGFSGAFCNSRTLDFEVLMLRTIRSTSRNASATTLWRCSSTQWISSYASKRSRNAAFSIAVSTSRRSEWTTKWYHAALPAPRRSSPQFRIPTRCWLPATSSRAQCRARRRIRATSWGRASMSLSTCIFWVLGWARNSVVLVQLACWERCILRNGKSKLTITLQSIIICST